MRNLLVIFINLFLYLNAFNQTPYKVIDVDVLLKMGESKGISVLENTVDPLLILYIDTLAGKRIADIEFKSGFIHKNPVVATQFTFDVPKYTLDIAKYLSDKYYDKLLLDYYLKIPRRIKSDTMYVLFFDLEKYLSVLIKRKPQEMIPILKKDYLFWSKLITSQPIKNVKKQTEELEEEVLEGDESKEDAEQVLNDTKMVCLQLAGALNRLKVAEFGDGFLKKYKIQLGESFQAYNFPLLIKESNFNKPVEVTDFELDKPIESIKLLASNEEALMKLMSNFIEKKSDQTISEVLFKGNKIFFVIHLESSDEAYRLTYLGKINLKVEKFIIVR